MAEALVDHSAELLHEASIDRVPVERSFRVLPHTDADRRIPLRIAAGKRDAHGVRVYVVLRIFPRGPKFVFSARVRLASRQLRRQGWPPLNVHPCMDWRVQKPQARQVRLAPTPYRGRSQVRRRRLASSSHLV